jgi:multidrug transporter EmrE-like cation transporter
MHPAVLALAVFSVSLNACAQIALRKTMVAVGPLPAGLLEIPRFAVAIGLNGWFLAGMASYAVSIGLWLLVLAKLEVSLAYPLLSVGYVITAIVGFFFLGEAVGAMRVAGIGLICAGIVIIAQSA